MSNYCKFKTSVKSIYKNNKLGFSHHESNKTKDKVEKENRDKIEKVTATMQSLKKGNYIKFTHNRKYLKKYTSTTHAGVVIAVSIDKLNRFVKCIVKIKKLDRFEHICISFNELIDNTYTIIQIIK
jgi:hypothetical protein